MAPGPHAGVTAPAPSGRRTDRRHAHRRRADLRRRVLALGLLSLGAGIVLGFGRVPAEPRPPAGRSAAPDVTPLLSVRRAPGAVVDEAGALRLDAELATVAARTGDASCWVVAAAAPRTRPIAARRGEVGLIPASTLKLATAAATLAVIGPEARLTTRVVAAAAPDPSGTVDRLTLVGGGDPLLATPEGAARREAAPWTRGQPTTPLAVLADRVVAAGVRAVPGGIVADDSRHDTLRWLPTWPERYGPDVGPLGALTVDGGRPGGVGAPAADPGLLAATALGRLLAERGVTVGPPSRGTAPAGAVTVASVASAPMAEVVGEMLAASDNLTAETLIRELAVRRGRPGTTADGVRVARDALVGLGLPVGGTTMVDGSGLSREDRMTCSLLTGILGLAGDERYRALHDGLAVAAETGTLAERFGGTPLAGRLRAKTGTLNGVSGLAGVVDGPRPLRFSVLLNGSFPDAQGLAGREAMALAIGRWPDVPGGVAVVPPPGG